MLINFRFENCRSFYDETNLSMQATADSTLSEINTFTVNEKVMDKGDNELLKSAVQKYVKVIGVENSAEMRPENPIS